MFRIRPHRRGASSGALIALVAAGAVLIAAGFGLGLVLRGSGDAKPVVAQPTSGGAEAAEAVGETAPPDAERTARPEQPPFAFDPPQLDFGYLAPRQDVVGTFKIRNVGDEPLRVLSMKPSCACTKVLKDPTGAVIAPGESAEVEIELGARDTGGERDTNIDFVFAPGGRGVMTLKAQYVRPVRTDPGYIQAMNAVRGQVALSSIDGEPFRVLAVNNGPPRFVGFDPASDERRNRYTLAWDISRYDPTTCADEDGNPMPRWLVVETDHPDAPVVELFIRHRCAMNEAPGAREWRPENQHVVIGAVRPGETVEFEEGIFWPKEVRPDEQMQTVLSESPLIEAKLLEVVGTPGSERVRVQITVKEDHPGGLLMAPIRVYGSRNGAPLMIIGSVRP